MTNVPEGPDGANVYREMNDAELKQWKLDAAAEKARAKAEAARPHPLVEQIAAMSGEDKAALAAALKGA
jgi:hypothetical protein